MSLVSLPSSIYPISRLFSRLNSPCLPHLNFSHLTTRGTRFTPLSSFLSTSPLLPASPTRTSPPISRAGVFIGGTEGHSFVEWRGKERLPDSATGGEDLGSDSEVFRKTLRLVECAMLAALAGLTYVLSNTLAIENYFGCFFAFPIVISSMRWGLAAGRKTMVATAMLLLTLCGPVKAATYLLMHGFVGLAMGSFWRLKMNWGLSILLCACVRALGAVGYVIISSFLIRENILYLIAINIHASLMGVFAAIGWNSFLSMNTVYTIFSVLLMINSACFVFLLHILYAVFLTKLGMKGSLAVPKWLGRSL